MNNTQSIIVYRNPMEQQFYESGMVFNVIVFIVLAVVFSLVLNWIVERFINFKTSRPWGSHYVYGNPIWNKIAVGVGIIAAGYVAFVRMVA